MATPAFFVLIAGTAQQAPPNQSFPGPVIVRAFDTLGNPMPGESVVFSFPASGPSATFSPSGLITDTVITNALGYGISSGFTANGLLGTWLGLVQFSAALGISANYSQTNVLTVLTPTNLSISSGALQKRTPGTPYGPLTILVKDQFNSPIGGIIVRFTVAAGHGTFPGGALFADAITAGTGLAISPTFTASATLGAFTVTISVPATPSLVPITTTWTTVSATTPTFVQAISGGGQQAPALTAFAQPLTVRVLNAINAPLAGVSVLFTAPGSGASCTFPTTTVSVASDVNGYAASPAPAANAINGTYFVVATVTGAVSAQFALTNGTSFLPEVCTTAAAPTNADSNPYTGSTQPWANTIRAINGNTNGAVVTIPTGADLSERLNCYNTFPPIYSPIADDARITKFTFTYDVKSARTGSSFPASTVALYNGSARRSAIVAGGPGIQDTWQSQSKTFTTFVSPTTITGAQLKAGGFGAGFVSTQGGSSAGTVAIRNVVMLVCYQNPDTSLGEVAVPLLFCEV